jgi:ATP-dependent Clp protease ATP-binding subunit ClpA
MDAANLLKPALARGAIRLIGATTTREYWQTIEKDGALERRFQPLRIEEPTPEEAIGILTALRERLEAHHGVKLDDAALRAAVEWSVRYLPDFRLPDKALDLVDQACAAVRFRTLTPQKRKISGGETPPERPGARCASHNAPERPGARCASHNASERAGAGRASHLPPERAAARCSSHLRVELDRSAGELILREGFSVEYGARNLERAVDRILGTLIAEALLSGRLNAAQVVRVVEGRLKLDASTGQDADH